MGEGQEQRHPRPWTRFREALANAGWHGRGGPWGLGRRTARRPWRHHGRGHLGGRGHSQTPYAAAQDTLTAVRPSAQNLLLEALTMSKDFARSLDKIHHKQLREMVRLLPDVCVYTSTVRRREDRCFDLILIL